jgi:hypothetical protein
MTDPALTDAIASTLDRLASMLGPEHAILARRLRDAHRHVLDEATSGLSDSTIEMLHDVQAGTMGGLSDVAFGSLVDRRWVNDEPRDREFYQLTRDLAGYVSALRPSGDTPSGLGLSPYGEVASSSRQGQGQRPRGTSDRDR